MRGKWLGGSALLLAALAALGFACKGSHHPTAPPPWLAVAGVWVGERSVAIVTKGEDTCLGRLLATRPPSQIRIEMELEEPPRLWAWLDIDDAGERCRLDGAVLGSAVSWNEFRCTPPCWWEAFECDGRLWSFCRTSAGQRQEFQGTVAAGRLTGSQPYAFRATAGDPATDYTVELLFRYDLHR